MTVWGVWIDFGSDRFELFGIYSSKEKAKKKRDELTDDGYCSSYLEYEVE